MKAMKIISKMKCENVGGVGEIMKMKSQAYQWRINVGIKYSVYVYVSYVYVISSINISIAYVIACNISTCLTCIPARTPHRCTPAEEKKREEKWRRRQVGME